MAKARKSVIVNVPLPFFYGIIVNYEAYPTFSKDVRTAEILQRDGNVSVVTFTIKVLTRPFDYTLRMTAEPPGAMQWQLVDSKTLKQNDGGWALEDMGDGTTAVTYWNEVASVLWLPKTFVNALVQVSMPRMLKQWKKHAEAQWAQLQQRPGPAP